jgi:integrase
MLKENNMDLTGFQKHLLINGNSQASTKTHCDKVMSFFRQYDAFTQENLNSFLASKIEKWNGNSYNLNINAFKHYVKFLKTDIEIPKYHKTEKHLKEYITKKELEDIILKIPLIFKNSIKAQIIFKFLFELGLRPKEILQLKRKHFDFENKTVLITKTKTHKDRNMPLSNVICGVLPAVFNREEEKQNAFNINNSYLHYICQRVNEMMGLKVKLHPYILRHSYAHNMLNKGIKISSLQVLMGHSNPLTTLGYLGVSEKEAIDEARNILNKRRKL